MQIVVTALLDQLYDLLRRAPQIVGLYAQKDAAYIPALVDWLVESEAVLERHRRPQVGEIAGIRAQVLAGAHAVYDRNSVSIPATGSPRKIYQANATVLFNRAQGILNAVHATFAPRREEAEKYIRQMLLISLQKNTFYSVWNLDLAVSQKLPALWQSFAADGDLVQGTRQVLSVVHYADALRVLAEMIDDLKL